MPAPERFCFGIHYPARSLGAPAPTQPRLTNSPNERPKRGKAVDTGVRGMRTHFHFSPNSTLFHKTFAPHVVVIERQREERVEETIHDRRTHT